MGLSGTAAATLLCRHGAKVALTDDKTERELKETMSALEELQIDYRLGGIDSELLFRSDLVVLSPGVPSCLSPIDLARKAGVQIVSEIELASAFCEAPVIAVTGTNGKTTTTSLIHHMTVRAGLRSVLAGNMEVPFSRVVGEGPLDIVVLEVSSFQLENIISFRPAVGVALNISPDHLDRYQNMEDYIAAKIRLFENHSPDDYAALNRDDPAVAAMANQVSSKLLWFSAREEVEQGAFLRGKTLVGRFEGGESEVMNLDDIPLPGKHNVENVLAAIAATLPIKLPAECREPAVKSFRGAEHRLERVKEKDGVLFVNDSKATNIDALEKSIASFDTPIILIAGGRGKKGGYRSLRGAVEEKVEAMITIGEDAPLLEKALGDIVPTQRAETLPDAVRRAAELARPGDCVLLAPGCASFDMFANYAHRGKVFKEAVEKL